MRKHATEASTMLVGTVTIASGTRFGSANVELTPPDGMGYEVVSIATYADETHANAAVAKAVVRRSKIVIADINAAHKTDAVAYARVVGEVGHVMVDSLLLSNMTLCAGWLSAVSASDLDVLFRVEAVLVKVDQATLIDVLQESM